MQRISFSRPAAAAQRSYTAMRTAAQQAQQITQTQPLLPEPESTGFSAEGAAAASPLAAAQLARQRAVSDFARSSQTAADGAAAQAAGTAP